MADVAEADAWRDRLLAHLEARVPHVETLERYYAGDHPLPRPPERMTNHAEAFKAFRTLSRLGVTNYVHLVPKAPASRLRVIGVRSGAGESADAAWTIWQRNLLDAESRLQQMSALTVGNAFAMVWPDAAGQAEVTFEHASQAIVAYAPGSRRKRAAGLKCWVEDDGSQRVVLYLPDEVWKWQRAGNPTTPGMDALLPTGSFEPWQPSTDDTWPIRNPVGAVPLVEYRTNPSLRPAMFGGGVGVFEAVLPIQDRINKGVFDRLVTAEFQAFRQRWAVGWTPANPNEAMKASMSSLWTFDDSPDDVKLGEFSQADFSPFVAAHEQDVRALGAITQTPLYSLGQLVNPPSADALQALQSGLVANTKDYRDSFTEAHEEMLRMALRIEGDALAGDFAMSMLWEDIEHVTWAEKSDALVKLSALGVPREELWSRIPGITPADVDRWRVMVADEALFAPEAPVADA